MVLEHQPDTAPVRGHRRLVGAVEQHPPGVQRLQPGDRPQQRGLAAAARPEHAHDLVRGDLQVDGVQRGPRAEPYGRALDPQQRRCPRLLRLARRRHQNSPERSAEVRRFSRISSEAAHTSIRMVLRAIAWP